MKSSVYNIDIYGEIQILFFSLMLKIVDTADVDSKCMRKLHNNLDIICVAYSLVPNWIFKEVQAL